MNTILTDDEIAAIQTQVLADFRRHVQEEGRGTASPASIGRAVEAAVLAKLAQQADRQRVPDGWKLVPAWKGYALLGTGNYVINHSADFDPELGAELIITLATDKDREGNRQIGESRPTQNPGDPIQADDMVIRIGFLNERGLFALEDQLAEIRKLHFAAPEAPAQAESDLLTIAYMDGFAKGKQEAQASAVDERANWTGGGGQR